MIDAEEQGLEFVYFNMLYMMSLVMEYAMYDMLLVVGGLIVIWFFVVGHTKSGFLATTGILTVCNVM